MTNVPIADDFRGIAAAVRQLERQRLADRIEMACRPEVMTVVPVTPPPAGKMHAAGRGLREILQTIHGGQQ